MRAMVVGLFAAALMSAGPVVAQGPAPNRAEPWRGPADPPGTRAADNRARVTSDVDASQPTVAEQREARTLAAAVFAKPAAARRAADKAAPEPAPDLTQVQVRPEWAGAGELKPGGRGVRVTTPF